LGLSRRGGGQIQGNVGVLQLSEHPSYYVIRWTQHRRPPQSSQSVGLPGGRPDFMLMLMLSDSLSDSWKSRPCALAFSSPDAPLWQQLCPLPATRTPCFTILAPPRPQSAPSPILWTGERPEIVFVGMGESSNHDKTQNSQRGSD
jgi:hypothetical protein